MTPAEIAAVLESSGAAVVGVFGSLSDELASWRPAEGEWCVKECVGHLIEAERRGFAGRIREMLKGDEPALHGWDAAEVAQARDDCRRDLSALLDEFAADRRDSIALIRSLTQDQLARGGMHPQVARITVGEIIQEWVHHDANHIRQALANVQDYVWPAMGGTQRFSSG